MGKKFNIGNAFSGIEWKNHLFGFLSVLIGVLVAFWLNDWNENKKIQRNVNNALVNLRTEIERNKETAKQIKASNFRQISYMKEIYDLLDDDLEPTVPDSVIVKIYSKIFETSEDSIESLGIEMDLYSLSDVAYNTFKESEILSNIDFQLAVKLADTYITQSKLSDLDDDLIDEAKLLDEGKESVRKTMRTMSIMDQVAEEIINNQYPESIEAINAYLEKHKHKTD
jgi:hypothetical protein